MSDTAVALETCVLRPGDDFAIDDEEVWWSIDEHVLSPDLRRHLRQNGLRAGICPGQLPPSLVELLDSSVSEHDSAGLAELVANPGKPRFDTWRRQLRPDLPTELVASGDYITTDILIREADDTLHAKTLENARAALAATVEPRTDGRARLRISVTLRSGRPAVQYHVNEGNILPKFEQANVVLPHLELDVTLAPGQTLVIEGLPEMRKSVGGHVFDLTNAASTRPAFLLVRLSQTQIDNAFHVAEE
jgi:hypothetical protein